MEKTHADALLINHVLKRINLSKDEQIHFTSLFTFRKILPRQYLLQQGEICKYEFFIVEGFLRSFFVDKLGNDQTLNFAFEDWWISDSKSFLQSLPSEINIVAHEPTFVMQIEKGILAQLYLDFPIFDRFWRLLNQNFNLSQSERVLNAISMNGAERYQALIVKYPKIESRLAQKHIASYLGITPVFLSMIRRSHSNIK
ncbi:Crp/Fnr family transcriptional regulator [Pedobacter cryoconitis]|uniref:Crp/Fnr family transcriptional regulator n=1 Tax=Pedobacter cryoconitis TaxID=188932 RepID=A0A127V6T2_9SPHI|nr:Crp/Fnr family transcriptional regulator [Pedobacter cryoconitis]AMP97112.1 Crp/Fnr family transcriptional regulator [Pedobacter cryoconitis]